MSLIHHLFQEIDDAEKREGEMQCFISHEFRNKDLRDKLNRALTQLGLCAYFADKELSGGFILHKVCKKILITRASIVDLTSANPNVYFELGVAIGLNKPVFIVLKQHAIVPTLLENFVKLRFTSYAGLERDLVTQAPNWLKESVEHHLLYNTHCHFANLLCPDRQRFTPRRRYLVIDQIAGTDAAGQPHLAPDPDLRDVVPEALNRFYFTPIFLDEVQPGVGFRLCDYCRTLRDSDFALVHLTRRTTPNAYLLLGLVTGLGIPSLLLHRKEHDRDGFAIPSMLWGLDRFDYTSYTEIGEKLGESVEGFLNSAKHKPIPGHVLFPLERGRREEQETAEEGTEEQDARRMLRVLIVEDIDQWQDLLYDILKKELSGIEVDMAESKARAIELVSQHAYQLIISGTKLNPEKDDRDSLEFIRIVRQRGINTPIVIFTAYITSREMRETFTELNVFDVVDKGDFDIETFQRTIRHALENPAIHIPVSQQQSLQPSDDFEELGRRLQSPYEAVAQVALADFFRAVHNLSVRDDIAGLRAALIFAQSIADPVHQADALIVVVDALGKVNDAEGVRRVVEVVLALEEAEAQERVLRAAAEGYRQMGEGEKADLIMQMIVGSQPVNEVRSPSSHNQQSRIAQPLRVFLSHSSRDKPAVRELYKRLQDAGMVPWLDEEYLLPGQHWRTEILKAVRDADVVLVCLSHSSVDQAGYMQKEIKLAIDVADELPEGSIFVIPVRLEECAVPERLSFLHWVNLFEERGYELLMRALQHRAKQLGREIAPSP